MDGRWPFSSEEKPKQTENVYMKLFDPDPIVTELYIIKKGKCRNVCSLLGNFEVLSCPLRYPFLTQFGRPVV